MKLISASAFLLIVTLAAPALAHPGRTNAGGCHNDRKSGGYHCHGGGSSSGGGGASSPTPVYIQPRSTPRIDPTQIGVMYAKVLSVGDGDTFQAETTVGAITVRLACIDAPEMAQAPYGRMASNRLKQLLPIGQKITLRVVESDRYGRQVAEVWNGNTSVNLQMVQNGMAVSYPQYLKNCPQMSNAIVQAEQSAKQRKIGFWQQANPQMPYNYRRSR